MIHFETTNMAFQGHMPLYLLSPLPRKLKPLLEFPTSFGGCPTNPWWWGGGPENLWIASLLPSLGPPQ